MDAGILGRSRCRKGWCRTPSRISNPSAACSTSPSWPSGRGWLQQEASLDHWRVVVICPHRNLNFGRPQAVAEFLRERVHWIERKLYSISRAPATLRPGW